MKLTLQITAEHRPDDSMERRLAEHVEQVRLARQVGFDEVSIGTHMSYGSAAWFTPFETLMRLAAEADGMSLATCMVVLPFYHPLHVAQQVAMLDAACGGRVKFGVSPGVAAGRVQDPGARSRPANRSLSGSGHLDPAALRGRGGQFLRQALQGRKCNAGS